MSFVDAIKSGFKNYFNFKGKAPRSEFWYWVLFTALFTTVLGTIDSVIWPPAASNDDWMQNLDVTLSNPTPLSNIASLVLFIPNLSMAARRFHDAGFSAKWLFAQLVPFVYAIFAGFGIIAILSTLTGEMLSSQQLMTIVFLGIPIFALGAAVVVIYLVFALRPSKSFFDGNKYVEPEPLGPLDEGTTA
jgi:uncharacterized membrane protein YhaH (DUF805 family)